MKKIIFALMFVFMTLSCSNDKTTNYMVTTGYITCYKTTDFRYDELMFKTDNGNLIPFYIDVVENTIENDNLKLYGKNHTHLYIKYQIITVYGESRPDNIVVIKELNK